MYVPHYDAILHAIGTSRKDLEGKTEVTVPIALFKTLLQNMVAHSEFNQSGYLAVNPDIQDAARKGQIPDPRQHYVRFGFFEGRRGATPAVDENWYRRTYADIGAAVRKGDVSTGSDHFNMIGAEEFRAPSATYEAEAAAWKRLCRGG